MKIKDQKEHVTLLVQCKCIGAVADRDYWIFSSGEVSGVQEHTHFPTCQPSVPFIQQKTGQRHQEREKKEGNFLLAKTWFNSTHNSSQIPTHNIDSFQK